MAPVFLNSLHVPFYGLVAGAVFITWSLVKTVQYFQSWKYARDNGCQPPVHSVSHGPFGIGMVREILQAGRENKFLEIICGWHKTYGKTFQARMANRKVIFTVESRNIQTILALKFKDFGIGATRMNALHSLLGHGIFTAEGSLWEHSRGLLRPNFSRGRITDTQLHEAHVANLIKQIPRDGSTVDLTELFFRLTLDTATEFLFGESTHTLCADGSAEGAAFAESFNIAQEVTALRFRIGSLGIFYRHREYTKAVKNTRAFVDRFVQKAIDYRIAANNGEKVDEKIKHLTDYQYVFSYELSKQTLDKTEITDQLLSILLAGRDTTANLLGITFSIMARRPDVWNRLREEVLGLDGRKPTFEELKSMTYLKWVLNETLRLYPIAPFNRRQAKIDTHLPVGGGPDGKSPVFVPKGQEVLFSFHTMHRDPEIYGPDAHEYRPERWADLRPGWAYLPFNGGPRVCIGQQFALTEAGYIIVRLLQEFEGIENRDPHPFVENLTLTLSSGNGTKVALTPVQV